MSPLQKNLEHSRAAYTFALRSLPSSKSEFPLECNDIQFDKPSQIESMVVELGWAFFCRYEACLEAYIKGKGIKLSKNLSLYDWLVNQKIDVPLQLQEGLLLYRKIRNKLHHEDGAALEGSRDEEIHLFPDHMENFYDLFVWCGEQIETSTSNR